MTDYISRQAAIEKLEHDPIGRLIIDKYNVRGWLEGLPAADVVAVVRCKDCKYWKYDCDGDFDIQYGYCEHCHWENYERGIETTDSDYCSFGERADK